MTSRDYDENSYLSFNEGYDTNSERSQSVNTVNHLNQSTDLTSLSSDQTKAIDVKVVLVGESNVGKSSLTLRFITKQFREKLQSTIGASFLSKTIHVPILSPLDSRSIDSNITSTNTNNSKKRKVKFNIWDTAGQEKYRSLASLYYRGVDCAIVVYDITDRKSFENVKNYWISELLSQVETGKKIQICIAGNKSDLQPELRQVSYDEGKAFAEKYNALFYETSAKTNENIEEMFMSLALYLPALDDRSTSEKYKLNTQRKFRSACC